MKKYLFAFAVAASLTLSYAAISSGNRSRDETARHPQRCRRARPLSHKRS